MAIPKQLAYSSNKQLADLRAEHNILRFRSDNQTYRPGQTLRIEIPTSQNFHLFPHDSFLEGYIQLKDSDVTGATAARNVLLSDGIFSVIKTLRIFHGSQLLEEIQYANRLYSMLLDIQTSSSNRLSNGYLIQQVLVPNIATNNNSGLIPFCCMLPSSILGFMAEKALPLGYLSSSSIYLEIVCEEANIAITGSHATEISTKGTYELTDVRFNCKTLKLSPSVEQSLMSSFGGTVLFPSTTWRGEFKTFDSTTFNDKFAFNLSSVKNFVFFLQNPDQANGLRYDVSPISRRPFCNILSYTLDIGGMKFPSENIDNPARMYFELLRAFNELGNINRDANRIGRVTYQAGTHAVDSVVDATFIGGIDLDRYPHDGTQQSGTNLIGQTLSLNLNLAQKSNLHLYAYCMHDIIYELQNGLLIPKY